MSEIDRLREGVKRIKDAERGEAPAQRTFAQLKDEATTPAGIDTLAIEGRRTGRSNGGIACDVSSGPCACGAWH
jgi:hypothetical protein